MVRFNGTDYFYVYNVQGDVVAMIDASGTQVVEYHYDAWGAPVSKTGTLANTLGTVNPFRYRGYVFDEETGLYYHTHYLPLQDVVDFLTEQFEMMQTASRNLDRDMTVCQCEYRKEGKQE